MNNIEIIFTMVLFFGTGWFLGSLFEKSKDLSERVRNNIGC